LGYGDLLWHFETVDLSAFAPAIVKVQFRGTGASTDFVDDNAIDDVSYFDAGPPPTGQPARAGLAVLDCNNAVNGQGSMVADMIAGPFNTGVTQGGPVDFTWEGPANLPLTLFFGPLGATLPVASFGGGVGNVDVGTLPLNMAGIPGGLSLFIDGITWFNLGGAPGFTIDAYGFQGPGGTGGISLNLPAFGLPSGFVLGTFQMAQSLAAMPFFALSNAVTLTVN
jgi:hypothetical protein